MEIICNFVQQDEHFCYYKIFNHEIPEKIISLKVIHPSGKSNLDVKYLNIAHCAITKIPQGLTKIFPSLEMLDIEDTNLNKIIKADLTEYKNLQGFFCDDNKIEFLAGNLFEEFKNLEKISFNGNDIAVIQPNILDGLDKLVFVDFYNNENYDCCFSTDSKSEASTLIDFKQHLFEKFCSSNPQEIQKFIKIFQNKVKMLTTANEKFKVKIQQLEKIENKGFVMSNSLPNATKVNSTQPDMDLINDNQLQSSFHLDIKNFIDNENFKDFYIQIDDREFKVHKFILAARSPTLADIFLKKPEAENLKLVDISVETFEQILHFMYTDELPVDKGTNFLQLYGAAGRLGINELKNIAEIKVMTDITPENAVEVLILSNKFKNNEIRQKAFDEIKKEHPEVPDSWIDKPEKVKKFVEIFTEN